MRRRALRTISMLAVAGLAMVAQPASARQYCVGTTGTVCDGGTFAFDAAGLSAALEAARNRAGTDELRLAPGRLALTAGISERDLAINGSPGAQGTTTLEFAASVSSAVSLSGASSVSDLNLVGSGGVGLDFTTPAGARSVDRVRLRGFLTGVSATGTQATTMPIRNTHIDLVDRTGAAGIVASALFVPLPVPSPIIQFSDVSPTHVTISGRGSGQVGLLATSAGFDPRIDVRNSIIALRGSGASTARCTPSGGSVVTLTQSAYRPTSDGCGALPAPTVNLATTTPWFIDEFSGDYRLQAASPMLDRAAGLVAPGATDARGENRRVDGDGDGTATADLGAFEYQRRPPDSPQITVPSALVGPGEAVEFAATVRDPDGEFATLQWNFGDGSPASGSPTHTFAALGTYTVTATATDPAGLTSSAQIAITVANPVPSPAPTSGGPSTAALGTDAGPRVRLVAAPTRSIRRTRRGFATVTRGAPHVATVDVAGATTLRITLTRLRPGRRTTGGRCRTGARTGKRCTVRTRVRSIAQVPARSGLVHLQFGGTLGGKRLPAGRYEARVEPVGLDRTRGTAITYAMRLR